MPHCPEDSAIVRTVETANLAIGYSLLMVGQFALGVAVHSRAAYQLGQRDVPCIIHPPYGSITRLLL